MAPRFDTITFLSDYGTDDEFVGVVHSVIRSLAPEVRVIDLTHAVPPHDVRAGALALGRSAQYLCPGVVLAVVDPGVGTDRRGIAVEVGGGQSYLVGPDNGLLAPAVAMSGGATAAAELANVEYQLEAPGPTFAGRDVFAPVAAHLCNGVPLEALGPAVDPLSLLPGILPVPRREGAALVAEVIWVDRFGNCQLNADPEELDHLGVEVVLRWGDDVRRASRARTYQEIPDGGVGLVVDSYGMLSICLGRRSAAAELRMATGTEVTLAPPGEPGPAAATSRTQAVTLGRRRSEP